VIVTGTLLDDLRLSQTGASPGGVPAGSFLVFAGWPDADACIPLSYRLMARFEEDDRNGALVIDATGIIAAGEAEGSTPFTVYASRLRYVPELLDKLGDSFGLVVLHSLDAWLDWQSEKELHRLLEATVRLQMTIVLHTKMLLDGGVFGGSMLKPMASAAFSIAVLQPYEPQYLWGRELLPSKAKEEMP
jgi:hypothetical protein